MNANKKDEIVRAEANPFKAHPAYLPGRPKHFCSVSWDKKVNSCSFAPNKEPLETLDYAGLVSALGKIKWEKC